MSLVSPPSSNGWTIPLRAQGFCIQELSAQGFFVQGLSVQGFCGQGFCNLHTGILRTGIKRIGFKRTGILCRGIKRTGTKRTGILRTKSPLNGTDGRDQPGTWEHQFYAIELNIQTNERSWFLSVMWIRIRSDHWHHFDGSGSVFISTKCKTKLYFFLEKFNLL
jgi:hypothetical protein